MALVQGVFASKFVGSVGNVTFRVKNGNCYVSEKAVTVSNPQTEAQMQQRCKMATVVQAYSNLKAIVDHSFEGISTGSNSMSYFNKINLNNLQKPTQGVYSFLAKGNKIVAPFAFIVSTGSLGTTNVKFTADGFQLGTDPTLDELVTLTGAQKGDQITFLQVCNTTVNGGISTEGGTQQNECRVYKARVTIKSTVAGTEKVFISGAFNEAAFENIEIDGELSINNGSLSLATTTTCMLGTVILSRKSSGKWLRSTQRLQVAATSLAAYAGNYAVDTYDPTSPYYLNNASDASGDVESTTYAITLAGAGMNNVSLSAQSATVGSMIYVNPNSGYSISTISVVGDETGDTITSTIGDDGSAYFEMPMEAVIVNVAVEAAAAQYAISTAGTAAGQISLSSARAAEGTTITITKPANVTLTALSAANASGSAITISGVSNMLNTTSATTCTFTMPASAVTVTATLGTSGGDTDIS